MPTNTSASRSLTVVTGCRAPAGRRSQGRVTSTVSSTSTRWSRSASSSAFRASSARRISRRAAPTRWPASALACGGSAPISALASASGDRSPAWASRAAFSSSSVCAPAMASSASWSAAATASGDSAVTSTGSYCLFGADIGFAIPRGLCWKVRSALGGQSLCHTAGACDCSPPACLVPGHPLAGLSEFGQAGGHGKSELGTAPGGALHGDRAAVRLDQPFDDVEAESRAATALGPPELAEDPRHEFRRDAVPLITDGDRDTLAPGPDGAGACGFLRLHHDSYGTSAVPYGILNKVPENLVDLVRVKPRLGEPVGGHHPVPVGWVAGCHPPGHDFLYSLRDADQLAVDLHPPRLDPRHVQQFGDQPGDPVRVGVDRFQHHPLLVVGKPPPLGQQRRGEALHAGQRRP